MKIIFENIKNKSKELVRPILPKFFESHQTGFDRQMLGYYSNSSLGEGMYDVITSTPNTNYDGCLELLKENCVCGWVPYIKGKTKLVIYNFFGINYSIRRNVLVRISICNRVGVISARIISLPPGQTHVEDFSANFNLDKLEDAHLAVVEIYHPRISTNHGGHNGNLRFWGAYTDNQGQYSATIHSAPLAFNAGIHKKFILFMSFSTSEKVQNSHHFSLVKKTELLGEKIGSPPGLVIKQKKWFDGFNAITDDEGGITGVWHNARHEHRQSYPLQQVASKLVKLTEQAFWIPPIKNILIIIFIDPYETQILHQEIQIDFFRNSEHLLTLNKSLNNSNCFNVDPHEFGGLKEEGVICVVKFTEEDASLFAYAHIGFKVGESQSDVVHMHISPVTNILNNKIQTVANGKSCLKFMHFPILKDESCCSWIMVWNKDIHHGDNQFSLRIINSKGRENIFYLQFSKKEIIKVVNLNELVDKDSDNHYIAQIESVCANYDATLLTHNKNTDHIAVDHLTGG